MAAQKAQLLLKFAQVAQVAAKGARAGSDNCGYDRGSCLIKSLVKVVWEFLLRPLLSVGWGWQDASR